MRHPRPLRPSRRRLPRARIGGAVALTVAACACAAPSAGAAGFGQPVAISGRDDASSPQVAIAPDGRTAVLYRRTTRGGNPGDFRVAIGPAPDRLGPATTLKAGWRARPSYADDDQGPQLLARPDGGFVVCFADRTSQRPHVDGCSIAPPGGPFGALQVVRRGAKAARLAAVVSPDNSTQVLLVEAGSAARATLTTLTPAGALSRTLPLPFGREIASDWGLAFAALDDGTLAVGATEEQAPHHAGVRLLRPGSAAFGPRIQVSDQELSGGLALLSGRLVVQSFVTGGPNWEPTSVQVLTPLQADGTLGAPLTAPDAASGALATALLDDGAGGFTGITSSTTTDPDDQDCFNPVTGRVIASTLRSGGPADPGVVVSRRRQIALFPHGVRLADGTVIASWEDASDWGGEARVEVAIRPPGATRFATPRPLPGSAWLHTSALAANGGAAVLAWSGPRSGTLGSPERVWVSAYRAAAPYAKLAPLPRRPGAPCDE